MGAYGIDTNQEGGVIEQERRREEENKKFRQQFAGYKEEINSFLEREAYEELLDYYMTDNFKKLCLLETEAAVINVVLSIYQEEVNNNSEKKILNGIHNMKEARERYLQAKFAMWRLEFFNERDGFLEFIEKNPVSSYFLIYLVHTSSFEKGDTAIKMAVFLKESGRFSQAFAMLNYVNDLCPDAEIVYCEMADICIRAGQLENAADCIGRIKNPSGILVGYRKKWGM